MVTSYDWIPSDVHCNRFAVSRKQWRLCERRYLQTKMVSKNFGLRDRSPLADIACGNAKIGP